MAERNYSVVSEKHVHNLEHPLKHLHLTLQRGEHCQMECFLSDFVFRQVMVTIVLDPKLQFIEWTL